MFFNVRVKSALEIVVNCSNLSIVIKLIITVSASPSTKYYRLLVFLVLIEAPLLSAVILVLGDTEISYIKVI